MYSTAGFDGQNARPRAAARVDAFSQCNLGWRYATGHGIRKNISKLQSVFAKRRHIDCTVVQSQPCHNTSTAARSEIAPYLNFAPNCF
jgi:hypothetical protein